MSAFYEEIGPKVVCKCMETSSFIHFSKNLIDYASLGLLAETECSLKCMKI
ncbi:MAG: Uncharacterised protein [Porticoccaceae bacterium UBA1117]|nr:MAG: Uncharacterised protein [Porticoccaceae bacterium UBA1117]